MELLRQIACVGRLEGELEQAISATFLQCNAINAARKGAQDIIDQLKLVSNVTTKASPDLYPSASPKPSPYSLADKANLHRFCPGGDPLEDKG
jgi:hypothetical protein